MRTRARVKYVQAKSAFIAGCIDTIEGHRKLVTMKAAGPKNAPSRYGTRYPSSCLKLLACATLADRVVPKPRWPGNKATAAGEAPQSTYSGYRTTFTYVSSALYGAWSKYVLRRLAEEVNCYTESPRPWTLSLLLRLRVKTGGRGNATRELRLVYIYNIKI